MITIPDILFPDEQLSDGTELFNNLYDMFFPHEKVSHKKLYKTKPYKYGKHAEK